MKTTANLTVVFSPISLRLLPESPLRPAIVVEDYCRVCGRRLEVESIPRGPPPAELAKYLEAAA